MKLGSPAHIERCKALAINEAVEICNDNMELGLDIISNILKSDREVIDEILRRHGIAGGES